MDGCCECRPDNVGTGELRRRITGDDDEQRPMTFGATPDGATSKVGIERDLGILGS